MLAFLRMAHTIAQKRRLCPRCGSFVFRDERLGIAEVLTRLLFLRRYRCTSECGWRGLRFSRSRLRRQSRRLKRILIVAAFLLAAASTVRYLVSRAGSISDGTGNEGIGEVAP